ncbi:branched-chain amino acid ABC transporter permease [Marinomonas profundimaris]|uniref:Branched-chain amino acid ABC transporter permease n=1 Tax=Marinomonas profundimaris TaxID=1208321 RepID=W1RR82_9GAMM|nr:branched-chain amino acid ABC transporter permease [Marinomonas profundimaris]ETI59686.1 branched-chain amino acid ABC transporter permease [Marinomonas profundimaris]
MKTQSVLFITAIALLLAIPFLLSQGLVDAAIQMLIAALFASAYNLLCGQAGMLSFGHAAYFGMGAFATVHAMNALDGTGLLPTPFMPLAGAVGGLLFGIVAGYFSTKRSGTYFAMITLAIAELVHALAPQLKDMFGGESGISAMRMPAWGFTFGSTNEVYYLTLVWVLLSIALLFLFTRTPLGRLTLGLRENAHRLRFLGYNTHRLSIMVFAISAMFSGIAGGLQVVSNEAANYVLFDAHLSAAVVLNTYIGGVGSFLGPVLGASVMTFFGYAVSDLTQSWLLYQGTLFVLVMMFMPTGLAGIIASLGGLHKRFGVASLAPLVVLSVISALLLSAGGTFVIEMLQRMLSQNYQSLASLQTATRWPDILLFGQSWPPASISTWLVPISLLAVGAVMGYLAKQWVQILIQREALKSESNQSEKEVVE